MFDIKSLTKQQMPFYYMHHSLKKAKTILKHAIFLIGQIRAGKSTTFNWITKPNILLGCQYGIQTKYILTNTEGPIAEANSQYKSVTMVPNIAIIQQKNMQVNLIDLPGFHDSRTSVQMMMVNYVINTCFYNCQQVKFIIVISHEEFINTNGNAFINTLKEFVKFFRGFPTEERAQVFKSASLVITSAKVSQYDSSKQQYLTTLKINMAKIQSLNQVNEQVTKYYRLIEELVNSIIKDKRLELFKAAQPNQFATDSPIITQLNSCEWEYYNLKTFRQKIIYPYQENYSKLSQEKKKQIDQIIKNKLQQFQNLQKGLVKIISKYLENPFDRSINLTENFAQLKKIIEVNRVHEDIPDLKCNLNEKDAILSQFNPINIFNNINFLYDLMFQIKADDQRSIQQRQKVHYLTYLSTFFQKSLKLFAQSFALREQYEEIINVIHEIFNQLFQEFIFITKINKGLISDSNLRLKEAIQIMNRTQYHRHQIPIFFIKALSQEDLQNGQHQYGQGQISSIINFLNVLLDWSQYDIKDKFKLLAKAYKAKANCQFKNQLYDESANSLMNSFGNALRYKVILQNKPKQSKEEQVLAYQILIQEITKNIYASLYFIDHKLILQLFKNHGLHFFIQQAFSDIQYHQDQRNCVYKSWSFYASFYQQKGKFSAAKVLYGKLSKNPEIKLQGRQSQIKQKQRFCQIKARSEIHVETTNLLDTDILIIIFNQINSHILKNQIFFNKSLIKDQVLNYFKSKVINVRQNQFDYLISQKPSYSEIIRISQNLIKKIKQRKVIIMLGGKSGKTTAFYFLQQKEIKSRLIGKKEYIYDLVDNKSNRKINHKDRETFLVPNMYQYNQGQILIDFCRLFQKKLMNAIILFYILKLIIQNSKAIKFLFVLKEDNVLKDEGCQIVKILQLVKDMFHQQYQNIDQNIAFLVNYNIYPQSFQQIYKKILQQFSKQYKNQDKFQQRYEIDILNQKPFFECMTKIQNNSKIIFMPKANKDIKLQKFDLNKFSQEKEWFFTDTININKSKLYQPLSSFFSINKEIQQINNILICSYKNTKKSMKKLQIIFESVANSSQIQNPFQILQVSKQFIDKLQISFENDYKLKSHQFFILNQIFAFNQLISYSSTYHHISYLPLFKSFIIEIIKRMSKMSFNQVDLLKCLYFIQKQLNDIIILLEVIDSVPNRSEFKIIISQICHLYDQQSWFHDLSCSIQKPLAILISQLSIDNLVTQQEEFKISPCIHLLEFILFCEQFSNYNMKQKQKLALIKCKELSKNEKNYSNISYCLFTLFKLSYCQYLQNKDDNKYKIQLIKLVKEMILVLTELDSSFAFRICDFLQCDTIRCDIYDKLISIKQQKEQKLAVLKLYLQFSFQIGCKEKFMELCEMIDIMEEKQQEKLVYNQRYNKILKNQLELIHRKKTFYDRIGSIDIQELKQKVQQIKVYFESINLKQA